LAARARGPKTAAVAASPAASAGQVDDASTKPVTIVATFTPSLPTGPSLDGECWVGSAAASGRTDAWRCTTGNNISDPCFSIAARQDVVVCGADPTAGDVGFVLRLTKPLPADARSGSPAPWLLRLVDGQTCRLLTGTAPVIHGELAPWSCTRGYVTKIDRGGPAWSAEWYPSAAGVAGITENAPALPTMLAVNAGWE
jgi:hypothetical protein